MKIASIIGARPQFIKSCPVSEKVQSSNQISEIIIHTGQHYDKNMSNIFFDEMEIPIPKYNLNINQIEYNLMIDKMIRAISPILIEERIQGVLVYGDTNSTLSASIAAKNLKIPLFHVESGLRSYDRSMHEENNRIITDHLSTLLFCPSKNAVDNLYKEKINEGVLLSGDIMYDAFLKFSDKNNNTDGKTPFSDYVLATIHRRENIFSSKKLTIIIEHLDRISETCNVIMPLHPHTKKMLEEYNIKPKINLIDPQGYLSMLSLLKNCKLVITDSGGLQKEAFFAKKKCIVVRKQTEWTELVNEGASSLSDAKHIYNNYKKTLQENKSSFISKIYGEGNASEIIVKSIVNYLNR